MLEIRLLMNTSAEEVLAFKTCCSLNMRDQNLEIHVTNRGERPATVQSRFELEGPQGTRRIDNLMPQGDRTVAPGETVAFYCYMDESVWNEATTAVFFDGRGDSLRVPVEPARGGEHGDSAVQR